MVDLSKFIDAELHDEIASRDRRANEEYWRQRALKAKYRCPDCGMPDSYHDVNCRSDTSE